MNRITVEVQPDFLQKVAGGKNAMTNLSELIWNGFDADANEVRVSLNITALGALDEIRVTDTGRGMPYSEATMVFKMLGGSWKKLKAKTDSGRMLHGKAGKGRFRAFGLGSKVEWLTRYKKDNDYYEYKIFGMSETPGVFEAEDEHLSNVNVTGTEVRITGIHKNFISLMLENGAAEDVAAIFALYLKQYPNISLWYDGRKIEPSSVVDKSTDYELPVIVLNDGHQFDASLTIIEWKTAVEKRSLFLCDSNGFSLEETGSGIQAPGFNFTGYVKSELVRSLETEGTLSLDELNMNLTPLLTAAKTKMKEHFRKRATERAAGVVESWKKQDIYPYKDEPKGPVEQAERQVFDVCAISVHSYLPDFEESSNNAKRMTLALLKQAIEGGPENVQKILQDVLNLPKEKQQELSELLERTTLAAIINASKEVTDRLNFLKGLEAIVYDTDVRNEVKERAHMHPILAEKTWLFGEYFNLTVSDESLTQVLRKHAQLLGRDAKEIDPVRREDGTFGRIDLMFSRQLPIHIEKQREHLIVELKRPGTVLNTEMTSQIRGYALAVARDERFKGVDTTWNFWLISNDMTPDVEAESHQSGLPEGVLFKNSDGTITIWVKTWAQVITECQGRLKFYQDRLKYQADHDSGVEYLRKTHSKYLPSAIADINLAPAAK